MKPTKDAHILRNIFKELGYPTRVCPQGYLTEKADHPEIQGTAKQFAKDYFAYNIARKREPVKATVPQMRNALGKWTESEWRCQVLNWTGWWVCPIDSRKRKQMERLVRRTKSIISRILLDEWPTYEFSPTSGATALTQRKFSFAASKVCGIPLLHDVPAPHKCNTSAKHHLIEMFLANPAVAARFHYARDRLTPEHQNGAPTGPELCDLADWLTENVPPAKLSFVAKDCDSVRLIALSNSLTIMVQKTFGDVIRKCLKKVGVDLNDQTINQQWAEIGSITNLIATVDLSSASDSIALRHLSWFPARWQEFVMSTRDTHVEVDGVSHKLNMVAGMGNGLIFELESLLFYAMSVAVVEELDLDTSFVSVYGDDIVIPTGAYTLLEEFFQCYGFLVNNDKSYYKGPFRESCGKHFYNGVDVSPFFFRGNVEDVQDLYHLYNGLSEWSCRTGINLSKSIEYVGGLIPKADRLYVPDSWGTRSGLKYPIIDGRGPQRKWNKRYQRFEYIYRPLMEGKLDVLSRLPDRTQVVTWLLAAEVPRENLVSPDVLFKLSRLCHSKGLKPHGSLFEACVASASWSAPAKRKQYRSVSFEGDA